MQTRETAAAGIKMVARLLSMLTGSTGKLNTMICVQFAQAPQHLPKLESVISNTYIRKTKLLGCMNAPLSSRIFQLPKNFPLNYNLLLIIQINICAAAGNIF